MAAARPVTHQTVRILRYPDGVERCIRYPAAPAMATLDASSTVDASVDDVEPGWDATAWDVAGRSALLAAKQQSSLQQQSQEQPPTPSLQETTAFLESLFAQSYQAQPLLDVEHCYQILQGCPWVLPRPVFVLTRSRLPGAAEDLQAAYTLRVRLAHEGAADALAALLHKPHLAAALQVGEMRDGLVVFEAPEDADRYASMLEEEGHSQVLVAEVNSHRAFRMVAEVRGLVVLLPHGTPLPQPYQLAASLKQKKAWDQL